MNLTRNPALRAPEPPLDPPVEPNKELDLALTRAHSQVKLALVKCGDAADLLGCNPDSDGAVKDCENILATIERIAKEKGIEL